MSRLRRGASPALLFLAPGILGFLLFYIWPFCISLGYAFLDKPMGGSFVGIRNFLDLLGSKTYLKGLANTLKFIAVSVPLNMALSLGVAMLVNRSGKRRERYALVFLIPLVIPSGSMVFFWRAVFAGDGFLNGVLRSVGLPKVNWLDSELALLVMVLIFVWKNLGYNMVLYLSGIGSIPREHYEAAGVDGARPWQVFRHITLPSLASTSVLVLIMSIVNSFKVFKEIYLITGAYPHDSIYTTQHFMNNMFASLNYPRLTTATTLLVIIIAVFTQSLLKMERRVSH